MVQNKAFTPLTAKHQSLIDSLLRCETKVEAAREAGVPHNTMYRWLRDPSFRAAYRAARHDLFDDALAVLEKSAVQAARSLADQLDPKTWESLKRCPVLISAAKAVLDRAFRAQDSIAVEEELANLRTILDALKSGQAPAPPDPLPPEEPPAQFPKSPWPAFSAAMTKARDAPPDEKPMETPKNDNEQAEAAVLRAAWMAEIGMGAQDIAASLRYNRPASVAEEQHLLDVVRERLEWERTHEVAMGTCTQ